MHFNRDELEGLPFTFPTTISREVVRSLMMEAQLLVQLCFPVQMKNGTLVDMEEAKTWENEKLQSALEDMELKFKETKVLLEKERKLQKEQWRLYPVIQEVPVVDHSLL